MPLSIPQIKSRKARSKFGEMKWVFGEVLSKKSLVQGMFDIELPYHFPPKFSEHPETVKIQTLYCQPLLDAMIFII